MKVLHVASDLTLPLDVVTQPREIRLAEDLAQ
jgi:hypothetical protein